LEIELASFLKMLLLYLPLAFGRQSDFGSPHSLGNARYYARNSIGWTGENTEADRGFVSSLDLDRY